VCPLSEAIVHTFVFGGYVTRFASFGNSVSKTSALGYQRLDRPFHFKVLQFVQTWTEKSEQEINLYHIQQLIIFERAEMKLSNCDAVKRIMYTRVLRVMTRVHRPYFKTGSIRVTANDLDLLTRLNRAEHAVHKDKCPECAANLTHSMVLQCTYNGVDSASAEVPAREKISLSSRPEIASTSWRKQ